MNLKKFRKLYPVKTICMHGSPLSKYDNRLLWETYSYRDFGIIGEPYFDVDFSEVLYLTDTGRRWDGFNFSVRDRAGFTIDDFGFANKKNKKEKLTLNEKLGLRFHSTRDIIDAAEAGLLPDKIMITVHPQRWRDSFFPWVKELLWQNGKNQVKRLLVK